MSFTGTKTFILTNKERIEKDKRDTSMWMSVFSPVFDLNMCFNCVFGFSVGLVL